MAGWRWPSPSQSSLGGGWKAAGTGGVEGSLGEHLAMGRFVSLHIGMVANGNVSENGAQQQC